MLIQDSHGRQCRSMFLSFRRQKGIQPWRNVSTDRQTAKLGSFICLQFTRHGHGQCFLFFTHTQLVLPPSESHYCITIISKVKDKGKCVRVLPWLPLDEGVRDSVGRTPRILNLTARRRWVLSFTSGRLAPEERTSNCIHWMEDWMGCRNRSVPCEKNNFLPLLGMEPW